jgi:hypothetical protein
VVIKANLTVYWCLLKKISEQLQRAESTTKEVKEQILELRGILFNVNLLQGLMHDVNITDYTNSTGPRVEPRDLKIWPYLLCGYYSIQNECLLVECTTCPNDDLKGALYVSSMWTYTPILFWTILYVLLKDLT